MTPMSDSSVESPVPSGSKIKRAASADDLAGRKKSKLDSANSGDEEQGDKEKAKATRGSRSVHDALNMNYCNTDDLQSLHCLQTPQGEEELVHSETS